MYDVSGKRYPFAADVIIMYARGYIINRIRYYTRAYGPPKFRWDPLKWTAECVMLYLLVQSPFVLQGNSTVTTFRCISYVMMIHLLTAETRDQWKHNLKHTRGRRDFAFVWKMWRLTGNNILDRFLAWEVCTKPTLCSCWWI